MKKHLLKILLVFLVMSLVFSFTSMAYAQDTVTYNKVVTDSFEYEFSPGDSWLLVQPAVCYITSAYFCYVFDTTANQWSDLYVYGPFGGTGFVVNPETGTIVTAGHIVDDVVADYVNLKWAVLDAYIFDNYPDEYFNLTNDDWDFIYDNFKVEGLNRTEPEREVWVQFNTAAGNVPDNPGDTFTRAEVISLSDRDQRDIAVLKITPVTGRALSSAIIGDSSMADIGSPLTMIGYPWTSDIGQGNTLNPTVTQGTISGRVMYRGTSVLQVQGDARPGNSGGPVISGENGTIIGILTMGTDNTNLYLRPANDVKALIGVENKLGQVDTEWRIGLAMYRQNHFSEALKHFDAVLNLSSGHLGAQEYKAKAQANMGSDVPLVAETVADETVTDIKTDVTIAEETVPEKSGFYFLGLNMIQLILIFGGMLLLIILIVVLIVFLVKRKKALKNDSGEAPGEDGVYIASPKSPAELSEGTAEQDSSVIDVDIDETEKEEAEDDTSDEPKKEKKDKKSKDKKAEEDNDRSQKKPKFCRNCGASLKEGQVFCTGCGNKLTG